MADKVVFKKGSQFETFTDLEKAIAQYEQQEFCVFSVCSSKLLHSSRDIPNDVVQKLVYSYRRYQSLFNGKPRQQQRNAEDDDTGNEVQLNGEDDEGNEH